MFVVGVLFRILVQKFRAYVDSPIELALAVPFVFGLFYAESNFCSYSWGPIVYLYRSKCDFAHFGTCKVSHSNFSA